MLSADHEARLSLSLALLFCGEDDFEEWDNDGGGRGGGAAADVALRGSNARENQKQCYYSTHLDGWKLIFAITLQCSSAWLEINLGQYPSILHEVTHFSALVLRPLTFGVADDVDIGRKRR